MIFPEISSQDTIILAFSGGADSRYLLEKFLENIDSGVTKKEQVIIAHFNHHMREDEEDAKMGKSEATRDAEFSEEISGKFGLRFELGHWNHLNPENSIKISENSARNARYDFLEKIRQKYSAKYIVTAHHQDDQAETIFLQFLRGGGVNALTGMRKISEERNVYRPLLEISKQKILKFLKEKKIEFVEDSSNAESVFTRNFLRNDIFPLLEKKFSGFSARIAEKSEYFQILQNEFERSAQKFLEQNDFEKGILRAKFLELSSAVQFEVIKKSIAPKFCDQKLFSEISGFIQNSDSGKKFLLKNFCFEVFGERVWMTEKSE